MTNEEIIKAIADVTHRAASNTRRIEKLEVEHEALIKMATTLEVLATKQDSIADKVDRIDGKVARLECAPAEEYNHYKRQIIGYIITAVLAVVLGLLFGKYI